MNIIDTGVGIKKEDQQNLFKLFSMAKSTKSMNRSGTGIGLYQSQKNAKLLGFPNGEGITVRSEWQKGSTFSFILQNKPMKLTADSTDE